MGDYFVPACNDQNVTKGPETKLLGSDVQHVSLGANCTVFNTVIQGYEGQPVAIGDNSRILNSVIEGHPGSLIRIGNNVTIENCHIEFVDITDDHTLESSIVIDNGVKLTQCHVQSTHETDPFEFSGWQVKPSSTHLYDGVVLSGSHIVNSTIGAGSRGSKAYIEYSHIGPRNNLRRFANMTYSSTSRDCNVGSEISKTIILGDGFVSEHQSSYLSLVAPADHLIVNETGDFEILSAIPNLSNIGAGSVFANYGGGLSKEAGRGSEKGTALVYSAFICINCRVINLYGQPDGPVKTPLELMERHYAERDLTMLGFGCFVENKITGRIPAFSYANDLSSGSHRLGWVLDKKPEIILNLMRKMGSVMAANGGSLSDLRKLIPGTMRLEQKLWREELHEQRPSLYKVAQLEAGLRILDEHLDGRWEMDISGAWQHQWHYDEGQGKWGCKRA